MQRKDPFLLLTMGDAGGIGPELIHQALESAYPTSSRPLAVGDLRILKRGGRAVGSKIEVVPIRNPENGDYRPGVLNVIDTGVPSPESAPFGKVSPESGKGSVLAIKRAYELSASHAARAIVSAPVNKEAVHTAGFTYIDETDLMNELTGASHAMLFLISDKMRMASLPPVHLSLKDACDNIDREKILKALETMRRSLASFGIAEPVIAVSALNPHGGEGGLFGDEEVRAIIPAVEEARNRGWDVRGPFPADTFFHRAYQEGFDALLTMYHDQGRIAMKTRDFGHIVIVMIGIPVPFVTPAHGTAYGKAGKGTADPTNFIQAMQFADEIQPATATP